MKPEERKPYLKIGDVARLVGVSPSVIRSWESLGLTRPRRTASKYRLYGPEDVKLLKRARFLRRVRGLNAPAIVQLLKRNGQVRSVPDGGARAIGVRLRQLRSQARSFSCPGGKICGHFCGISQRAGAFAHERLCFHAPQTGALLQDQHPGIFSIPLNPAFAWSRPTNAKCWRPAPGFAWNCWRGATP